MEYYIKKAINRNCWAIIAIYHGRKSVVTFNKNYQIAKIAFKNYSSGRWDYFPNHYSFDLYLTLFKKGNDDTI